MNQLSYVALLLLFTISIVFTSCDDDDVPPEENVEEEITDITLTFTPAGGSTPITATWVDADGEGSGNPVISDITLAANTTYTMSIELTNALDPSDPEDITAEVREENDEHMFFFGWSNNIFSDPTGDGNIGTGNRADPVNYEDSTDENGYPLGLETEWTTGDAAEGTFQIILKHQPPAGDGTPVKTATSDSSDGETDVDATWSVTIQ